MRSSRSRDREEDCQDARRCLRFSDPSYFLCQLTGTTSAQASGAKMPREAEISVNERAFIQQALQENIRLDGRAFDAFRSLKLTFGDEYGVADVQLGKTRYATCI
jgi:hypothetical protein